MLLKVSLASLVFGLYGFSRAMERSTPEPRVRLLIVIVL